jgi:hypothetical protein
MGIDVKTMAYTIDTNDTTDFDSVVSDICIFANATSKDRRSLINQARKLEVTTELSVRDVAGKMRFLASIGYNADEIISRMSKRFGRDNG